VSFAKRGERKEAKGGGFRVFGCRKLGFSWKKVSRYWELCTENYTILIIIKKDSGGKLDSEGRSKWLERCRGNTAVNFLLSLC
jgi:hypothetical protein